MKSIPDCGIVFMEGASVTPIVYLVIISMHNHFGLQPQIKSPILKHNKS